MKKTYYLFNPGRLSRKDNTLCFTPVDEDGKTDKPKYLPVEGVKEFFAFGSLDSNSAVLNFLGQQGIPVHYFDYYSNYTGSYMPRDSLLSGRVLVAQSLHYSNRKKRMVLATRLIDGAAANMLRNLKYYQSRGKLVEPDIAEIERLQEQIPQAQAPDELMGIEGNIRQAYYRGFDAILTDFKMGGRTKQPPLNEVNALVSFGNMMCYSLCLRQIYHTQLHPTISFLHEPGERRFSLALDLAEIFKPLLVDRTIFKMLNKRMLSGKDFDQHLNKCLLKDSGKKRFIGAWEERLAKTIQHRTLKRKVSYERLVRLEAYKLAKHILDIQEYEPFKMWW